MLTWAHARGVRLFLTQPSKPNQNAYIESFNGRLRDECLNEHWFVSLAHARAVTKKRFNVAASQIPNLIFNYWCQPTLPTSHLRKGTVTADGAEFVQDVSLVDTICLAVTLTDRLQIDPFRLLAHDRQPPFRRLPSI